MKHGSPHEMSIEDFKLSFDSNCTSIFLCMKYEIQQFLKQQEAENKLSGTEAESERGLAAAKNPNDLYLSWSPYSIVNNSSTSGLMGSSPVYAYGATKHAVCGLTKSAALTYAKKGIHINAICPGVVYTEMTETFPPLAIQLSRTPMGRVGQSDEIAELVSFLISNASSFITGATYPADGGLTAGG
ncbi:unnamed protein product [Didymodactylos carnosus]|uniref:Uncharacterized protein n=1 Tax=Didymodactylos carnosus TaxID=1234261 RepID=A0A8S2DLC3_9BILA|nr:unnamed protein product [Didymodactylos carnosus]CAF3721947.1 unnamed protein product [Didymodactylos carnosus]